MRGVDVYILLISQAIYSIRVDRLHCANLQKQQSIFFQSIKIV